MRRAQFAAVVLLTISVASLGCSKPAGEGGPGFVSPLAVGPGPIALVNTLRIVDLPSVTQRGQRLKPRVEIVNWKGTSACTTFPQWTVTDTKVVRVQGGCSTPSRCNPVYPPDEIFMNRSGFTTVKASCDSLTASVDVMVQEPAFRPSISDPEDGIVQTVGSRIEFLEGPRTGESRLVKDLSTLDVTGLVYPMRARLTARLYAPRDVVLSGQATTSESGTGFKMSMSYAGDGSTDSYVCHANNSECRNSMTYPFFVAKAGLVEVSSFNSAGDTSPRGNTFELWCGGQLLQKKGRETYGYFIGVALTQQIDQATACELKVSRDVSWVSYRVAITYPH